jgi:hypothetical protein
MFNTFVAQTIQGLSLTFLALTLPLSPFVCAILAADVRYLTRYFDTVGRCARMTRQMAKANVIARRISRELARAPVSPEEHVVGECTHCGKCCIHQSCVYLEMSADGKSSCAIYNNWFWRKTSCGTYPLSGPEIEVYDCPSFRAVPIKVVALPRQPKPLVATGEAQPPHDPAAPHVVIPMKRPAAPPNAPGHEEIRQPKHGPRN